jgi:hypothetical protein
VSSLPKCRREQHQQDKDLTTFQQAVAWMQRSEIQVCKWGWGLAWPPKTEVSPDCAAFRLGYGLVREKIGPAAAFKEVTVVERLPKTRSGKILRSTMKHIADGEEYKIPATIDDPATLGEIEEALESIGYGRRG